MKFDIISVIIFDGQRFFDVVALECEFLNKYMVGFIFFSFFIYNIKIGNSFEKFKWSCMLVVNSKPKAKLVSILVEWQSIFSSVILSEG